MAISTTTPVPEVTNTLSLPYDFALPVAVYHPGSHAEEQRLLDLAAADPDTRRQIETEAMKRLPKRLNPGGALYVLLYRAAMVEAATERLGCLS